MIWSKKTSISRTFITTFPKYQHQEVPIRGSTIPSKKPFSPIPKVTKGGQNAEGYNRQASNALMPSGRLSFHRQLSDPTALLTYLADDTWTHVHFIHLNCKSLAFCGRPLNIMPTVLRKPHHIGPLSDWKSQSYAVGKLLSWGIFVSFSRGEVVCFLGNERPSAFASKAFQFK